MARLTSKRRRKLRKSSFALPGNRKYPVHDKPHARNAKARASQMYKRGKISKSTRDKIFAKANKVLGKKGSAKRRTGRKRATKKRRTTRRRRRG